MTRTASCFAAALVLSSMSTFAVGCGCGGNPGSNARDEAPRRPKTPLDVTSSAFEDDGKIPIAYTKNDVDHSPPLAWQGAPSDTKSFAIVCEDKTAPGGTWVHWIVFNIPATTTKIASNQPKTEVILRSAKQGTNSFGDLGYGGPQPGDGKLHRYDFVVYALDCTLMLKPGCSRRELDEAMRGHVIAQGYVSGVYKQ